MHTTFNMINKLIKRLIQEELPPGTPVWCQNGDDTLVEGYVTEVLDDVMIAVRAHDTKEISHWRLETVTKLYL